MITMGTTSNTKHKSKIWKQNTKKLNVVQQYAWTHGYACPRGTNNPTLCKLMSTLYTGDIPSLFKLSTLANTVSISYFSYLTLLLSPWSGKHWNVRRLMTNLD